MIYNKYALVILYSNIHHNSWDISMNSYLKSNMAA